MDFLRINLSKYQQFHTLFKQKEGQVYGVVSIQSHWQPQYSTSELCLSQSPSGQAHRGVYLETVYYTYIFKYHVSKLKATM